MDERTKAKVIEFSRCAKYVKSSNIEEFIENIYQIGYLDGQIDVAKKVVTLGENNELR